MTWRRGFDQGTWRNCSVAAQPLGRTPQADRGRISSYGRGWHSHRTRPCRAHRGGADCHVAHRQQSFRYVNALNYALTRAVGDRGVVAVQNPVHLDDLSEPQADFAILKPSPDFYRRATPRPADVLLLIEVADSSLTYDRAIKRSVYARHGIAEFRIVNPVAGEVEVCRTPRGDHYASVSQAGREAVLEPELLPGASISVAILLG
jgi:Uma2 family endonuclease